MSLRFHDPKIARQHRAENAAWQRLMSDPARREKALALVVDEGCTRSEALQRLGGPNLTVAAMRPSSDEISAVMDRVIAARNAEFDRITGVKPTT